MNPLRAIADEDDSTLYYVLVVVNLLPVFLFFKLIQWMGWELFVNN